MNDCMCLPSLTAPKANLSITSERGAEFQMETEINCRRGFRSRTTKILMISRCYFSEDGEEIYAVLKRVF